MHLLFHRAPLRLEKRMPIALLLALFSLSSIVLAGCGGSSPTSGSSSKITLTVLESVGWVHQPEMDLAKKFEAQTGIHIDYQIIPAANYFQVLNTKLNSGQGPDIFGGQSGVSDLKVNYNVEANAVDLSNEEWVKREDPAAACPGDRQRQGVWPGDLGHLQRLLGHRLQQEHLPEGGDHQRPGDVQRFRGR